MEVGFIITAPYQVFHYEKIRRHLQDTRAYIEIREDDFGVTSKFVEERLPGTRVEWLNSADLKKIDGACDVLVCQTPVPLLKFFERSLVVAQQYSLAKEVYQYGLWRAQSSLNLMYGNHSLERVRGFSNAVAVGNPLLDDALVSGSAFGTEQVRMQSGPPKVLYMPTYGDISDKQSVLERLALQNIELSVKAHHADRQIIEMAAAMGMPVFLSDQDPVALIQSHDVVVSDYSGAVYDALALRKPVVLTEELNASSGQLARLSDEDANQSQVADLCSAWRFGSYFEQAYESSVAKIGNDEQYQRFVQRYFVNPGTAGRACAQAIESLAEEGEPENFAVSQIREPVKRYILNGRQLRATNRKLERQVKNLRAQLNQLKGRRKFSHRFTPRKIKEAALRGTKRLVLVLPGGGAVFPVLRRVRSLWRSPDGAARGILHHGQAPEESSNEHSLSLAPWQRREEVLALIEKALCHYRIEYRVHTMPGKAYCAVRLADLETLLPALKSLPDHVKLPGLQAYMGKGFRYNVIKPLSRVRAMDLADTESIAIGLPYANGSYQLGRESAAEILLLEPRGERLVSKRWRADKVDWTLDFKPDHIDERPKAPAVLNLHKLESEPVDLVYTWVDSEDPQWRQDRDYWAAREEQEVSEADTGEGMVSANNDERYLDRSELRYSLRSVWLYAPFIRNIYLVTSGHRPAWLNEEAENLHVITHQEIFPDADCLPTFNSHAIETCLHRIPGLAEHFIYFNDDVFLGQETTFGTFYTKSGLIKSRLSPSQFTTNVEPSPDAIPSDWASYNAVQLMERDFGLHFARKMKHVPMPMMKSVLAEIEARYPEVISRTRAARFRARSDLSIPSMFAHYYAIATGRGVEWENVPGEYVYCDTGRHDFQSKLAMVMQKQPTFLCLNATRYSDITREDQARMVEEFLSQRFPVVSPFECPSLYKNNGHSQRGEVV